MATLSTSSLLAAPTDGGYPFPGIPDDPDTADRNCRLFGPFALFVQAVMGVIVLGTLMLKRQREKPKRPWKIWTLDISKQMLGQLFVHILNVILSSLGSIASEGENNPCSLYFLNIAIDTTIGVLFIYFSMRYLTHYFTDVLGWPGFVSGQYTSTPTVLGRRRRRRNNEASFDEPRSPTSETTSNHHQDQSIQQSQPTTMNTSAPAQTPFTSTTNTLTTKRQKPRLAFFFRQLSLYLLSLLLMKVMVVTLFAIFPFLFDIGRWVLNMFGEHRKSQVFFVMAAFPLAMNTLQFWLIDSLLRHNPITSIYRSEEEAEAAAATNGTDDHFRDSRPSDVTTTNSEDVEQGRSRSSWWKSNGNRQEEEVRSHLVGDASEDDDDDDDNHSYPPPRSNSSSIGQLDKLKKPTNEIEDGTTVGLENVDASKSLAQEPHGTQQSSIADHAPPRHTTQTDAVGGEEEEDAWDNWDEDKTKTKMKQ